MKSNTVLDKIGMTDEIVIRWKNRGLKITFPMKKNKANLISKDGEVFIEAADKFFTPLSKQETDLFIKHPDKFSDVFLKNVKFFFNFHTFLFEESFKISKLESITKKLSASILLIYLFLSAMDNHYYHYDRYLVLEDYPETPVGYWWQQLKVFYFKVFGEKVGKNDYPPRFLLTASRSPVILTEYKLFLNKIDYQEFLKTIGLIKMFESVQQKEAEIVSGYPSKDDLLLRSGFGLWNNICKLIKKNPTLIQGKYRYKILKLIEGHPITSTRILLLTQQLKTFNKEIFTDFKKEIKRWL
jgi:hypothetical protein